MGFPWGQTKGDGDFLNISNNDDGGKTGASGKDFLVAWHTDLGQIDHISGHVFHGIHHSSKIRMGVD